MSTQFKKNIAPLLRRCAVFDSDAFNRPEDLFSNLLGIESRLVAVIDRTTSQVKDRIVNENEPQGIYCGIGNTKPIANMLETMIEAFAEPDNPDTSVADGSILFVSKQPSASGTIARSGVADLESIMHLTSNPVTEDETTLPSFRPDGIIGWGALNIELSLETPETRPLAEPIDAVKIVGSVNRMLRRLNVSGSQMDLIRAAVANLIQGNSVTSIRGSSDGVFNLIEVNLERTASPLVAAKNLASWLDRALNLGHNGCMVWIKKCGADAYRAGIVTSRKRIPPTLVVDLTDNRSENRSKSDVDDQKDQAVESNSQKGYNVA